MVGQIISNARSWYLNNMIHEVMLCGTNRTAKLSSNCFAREDILNNYSFDVCVINFLAIVCTLYLWLNSYYKLTHTLLQCEHITKRML